MQIPVGPSPSTVLPGCSVFMTQHLRTTTWSGIPEPFFLFGYNKKTVNIADLSCLNEKEKTISTLISSERKVSLYALRSFLPKTYH